jgi:hypothetical protein
VLFGLGDEFYVLEGRYQCREGDHRAGHTGGAVSGVRGAVGCDEGSAGEAVEDLPVSGQTVQLCGGSAA